MIQEKKYIIKNDLQDVILRSGEGEEISFCTEELSPTAHHRLFFTCENKISSVIKDEPFGDKLYMLIDDALDTENAVLERYCLDMSCDRPKEYLKCAVKKISWSPLRYGVYEAFENNGIWSLGIYAKAEKVQVGKDGFLRLRLDRWEKRDGVDPLYTAAPPDETIYIDVCEGTYGYTKLEKRIEIPDTTACVIITLEGMRYSGEVYFESPHLLPQCGFNVVPQFDCNVSGLSDYTWLGLNLSKKEWPRFEISLNGKAFFSDEFFLHVHRYSPVEIDIPQGLLKCGENELAIKYTSSYHDTVPVAIRECMILERPAEAFSVLFCPEFSVSGREVHILIETDSDNMTLICESSDFTPTSSLEFSEKGLHVISLRAAEQKNNMTLKLSCGGTEKVLTIPQAVLCTDDGVICGSGDMVYIDVSNKKQVSDYLAWYISNALGNLITVRPVYRWGGQRTVNSEVWKQFTQICNDMEISYVHLSDGRDLPGMAVNPSKEHMRGRCFLGRQLHERDGQTFYWGFSPRETTPVCEEFYDTALRLSRENPETIEGNYRQKNISRRDGQYIFKRNINCPADMKAAHDCAGATLHELCAEDFSRHTGPSVMFKYFYQSGFAWTGAETMDGTFEALVSFLRGAAKAYGRERFGVHHALQWSTYPHECEARYRRYWLALYLSYMHGVTDINTEEGLWFMEARYAYHNRLSEACKKHREVEKSLYDYITAHSRTGSFYTTTAFLQGRYDGWTGFGTRTVWGMPHMPVGDDCTSWRLLKAFYPLDHIETEGMAKTGYVAADTDSEYGIFSGTPNGCVDVVPVEDGVLDYSLLIFAGYNKAEEGDLKRLFDFVSHGGTLIACWPHFSDVTDRADILKDNFNVFKHPLTDMLSDGEAKFGAATVNGQKLKVCVNLPENAVVEEKTDDGAPLVYNVSCGKGRIVMVNAALFPGNSAVYSVYENVIKRYHQGFAVQEKYQLLCGEDVGYTVYRQENGAFHFYVTAVDWYNETDKVRKASLRIGGNTYPLELKFGRVLKIVAYDDIAVWAGDNKSEILSASGKNITLQGHGNAVLFAASGKEIERYNIEFGDAPSVSCTVD